MLICSDNLAFSCISRHLYVSVNTYVRLFRFVKFCPSFICDSIEYLRLRLRSYYYKSLRTTLIQFLHNLPTNYLLFNIVFALKQYKICHG